MFFRAFVYFVFYFSFGRPVDGRRPRSVQSDECFIQELLGETAPLATNDPENNPPTRLDVHDFRRPDSSRRRFRLVVHPFVDGPFSIVLYIIFYNIYTFEKRRRRRRNSATGPQCFETIRRARPRSANILYARVRNVYYTFLLLLIIIIIIVITIIFVVVVIPQTFVTDETIVYTICVFAYARSVAFSCRNYLNAPGHRDDLLLLNDRKTEKKLHFRVCVCVCARTASRPIGRWGLLSRCSSLEIPRHCSATVGR